MRRLIAVALCCGCRQILGFEEPIVVIDAVGDGANPSAVLGPIAHVGLTEQEAFSGTGELIISSPFTIDTTPNDPFEPLDLGDGNRLVYTYQSGNPDIMPITILEVRRLEVRDRLRVIGLRPLIIIAAEDVVITGTIDASADGTQAGPGVLDIAPGAIGQTDNTTYSGGGGGGFASIGGNGGGASAVAGSPGGLPFGNTVIAILGGGSLGGSDALGCANGGGAGGALQISAPSIVLDGVIDASGGGGSASSCTTTSGAGGGSGGAIYLQAITVSGNGLLVVTGGGGAGGSDGSGATGAAGQDPTSGNGYAAFGGAAGGSGAGSGGAGANGDAVNGFDGNDGAMAGGGGGGAAGRIFLDVPSAAMVTVDCRPGCSRR